MSTNRICLLGVSIEVTIRCNYGFLSSFIRKCKCSLLLPHSPELSSLILWNQKKRNISSELENHCPLSKFFIRGKSHMGRDQKHKLVVKGLEFDVLTDDLHQDCPAHCCTGAPTTWPSEDLMACVSLKHANV
ncbi:hypothetical protein AVEN_198405-1 [Araneus ventricosus]|uniref:Uncharacterized protein n=1 Tax=Araneus ventricosus TaxID=182803 RepID=A0A4Y2M2Z8_ARAVE|nr:hypothetical protein AVEN_130866-1 [Araneus ventricosus]GBN21405.1 hypothetical protein AVEN_157746-1 [Araneus ventricosus]GBN21455.1 hypothetical protein AVEN_198405-1 [Araneus ventricosus]